jgi:hypothetical protein
MEGESCFGFLLGKKLSLLYNTHSDYWDQSPSSPVGPLSLLSSLTTQPPVQSDHSPSCPVGPLSLVSSLTTSLLSSLTTSLLSSLATHLHLVSLLNNVSVELEYFNRSVSNCHQNEGQSRSIKTANKSSKIVENSGTLIGLKPDLYSQRSS